MFKFSSIIEVSAYNLEVMGSNFGTTSIITKDIKKGTYWCYVRYATKITKKGKFLNRYSLGFPDKVHEIPRSSSAL